MSQQLSSSTYREEFRCPPQGKPPRARPSSACRRNNPHPRPDFLLPRRLQTGYGARLVGLAPALLDHGPRYFPPLQRHAPACPEGGPACLQQRPSSVDRPVALKPTLTLAHRPSPPSTGQQCKPQVVHFSLRERQFQNSPRYAEGKAESQKSCLQSNGHLKGTQCFHSDIRPHIGQGNRGILGSEALKQPISKRPDNTTFARHPKPQMYFKKSRSTLDPSAVYSCFQVVKPYKAGYYIIHPEFISESLK